MSYSNFRNLLIFSTVLRYTQINSSDDFSQSTLYKNTYSPQLGIKYQIFDSLDWRFNLTRFERYPTFFELFGDHGFFLGNQYLLPEQGTQGSTGFAFNWQSTSWIQKISAQANYFNKNIQNLISRTYNGQGIGRSINIAQAKIQGFETQINLTLNDYFSFNLNSTLQQPINHQPATYYHEKLLPGHYMEDHFIRLNFKYNAVLFYFESQLQQYMAHDMANNIFSQNKSIYHAGIKWDTSKSTLTAVIKNLTNEQYEDFIGYPLPGISYGAIFKYQF